MSIYKSDIADNSGESVLTEKAESAERSRAEAAIKESEEKFRGMYESIKDGIVFLDLDLRVLDANRAFLDMHGYTLSEMIGVNLMEITPKKWADIDREALKRLMRDGDTGIIEKEHYRKDGSVVPVSVRVWLRKNEKGDPIGMWAVERDIAERKRGEDMIRMSERKFRGIFESIRDGIVFADLHGRILEANKAMLNMLGYAQAEMIGIHLSDITPAKWHDADESALARVMKEGDSGEYEKENIRQDGVIFPVVVRMWLMKDEEGIPNGLWALVRDVSEKMSSEQEIKKRMSEIEKLNRFMIGREERIIEVKKEVNELLRKMGEQPKYKV